MGVTGGQSLSVETNPQSPSSVNAGTSSIPTSSISYAYPQHMVVAQSAGLQVSYVCKTPQVFFETLIGFNVPNVV